jgi:hypothetical protein
VNVRPKTINAIRRNSRRFASEMIVPPIVVDDMVVLLCEFTDGMHVAADKDFQKAMIYPPDALETL